MAYLSYAIQSCNSEESKESNNTDTPFERNGIRVYDYLFKYTFLCEMCHEGDDSIFDVVMNFYPFDNSFQVVDPAKGKILLRRVQIPAITTNMLQMGNVVNIFGRFLMIVDCPISTQTSLFSNVESTFALIKPLPPAIVAKVITFIMNKGFRIVRMKNAKLDKEFTMELFKEAPGNALPYIVDYVTSGEVIGMELSAPHAVQTWLQCLGSTDPKEADPNSLRGLYGISPLQNVAHGCKSLEEAKRFLEEFFGYKDGLPKIPYRATATNCTCCIVKPHAILDGNLGSILEQIITSGSFYISAIAMFSVSLVTAKEFYEIYKGVLPEYEQMCSHLAEGKSAVLEIKNKDPTVNPVCGFRKLCGPRDPDVCRQLYPDTIRALYGKSLVHNAVHCTDLPEDGELEIEYFFKLLVNA